MVVAFQVVEVGMVSGGVVMRSGSCVVALCLAVCSTSATAATLQGVQGVILASSGKGFQRASNGADLAAGTRVVAKHASSAVIIYDNGCREKVEPGRVVTVKADKECRESIQRTHFVMGAVAVGAGVALAVGRSKPASP